MTMVESKAETLDQIQAMMNWRPAPSHQFIWLVWLASEMFSLGQTKGEKCVHMVTQTLEMSGMQNTKAH
jgi:hypothetical protein